MANIIAKTYFEGGELNIPGTEKTEVSEKVTTFIVKYEPDYLLRALGYPLYKLFNADAFPNPTEPRFIALMDGNVEYTNDNDETFLWQGLRSAIQSPIAMYIWYWYDRYSATYNSPTGRVKGKSENSAEADPKEKQMKVYNEMNRITGELWYFLKYYEIDGDAAFPEWDICQIKRPFGVVNTINI